MRVSNWEQRRPKYYILKGKEITTTEDIMEWGKAFEDVKSRIVAQEKIGEFHVSTVFLGLDHGFTMDPSNPPILFETIVFDRDGNETEEYTERYATWDKAYEGHRQKELDLRRLAGKEGG